MLCSLFRLVISGAAFGWPRRSTVDRSRGSDRRALRGIGAVPEGVEAAGLPFDDAPLLVAAPDGVLWEAEAEVAPPLLGGTTM